MSTGYSGGKVERQPKRPGGGKIAHMRGGTVNRPSVRDVSKVPGRGEGGGGEK